MRYSIFGALLFCLILGNGCVRDSVLPASNPPDMGVVSSTVADTPQSNDASTAQNKPLIAESESASSTTLRIMSRYEPFTQAAYEQALADGSPIYLFFYASWCPYCKAQEPINQAVFATNTFTRPVRGFRVNYNDSDTDADEKALARTFGVTYQHTGIFLDTDGKERKRVIGTQTEIQLREILNMIAP